MVRFEIASTLWGIAGVAALASSGCTALDEQADDCFDQQVCRVKIPLENEDSGTPNGPPPEDTAWGCLDTPAPPAASHPDTVLFAMAVVDFNNPTDAIAIPGLEVQVCQLLDFGCENPLTSPPAPDVPPPVTVLQNVPGRPPPLFMVGLPTDPQIDLYLRLNAPGYLQTEYYFLNELEILPGPPVDVGGGIQLPIIPGETITLPRDAKFDEFFQQVAGENVERQAGSGIIALRTFDCQGRRAEGVELEMLSNVPDGSVPWVFSQGAPILGTKTDDQGVAGFANVSPANGARIQLRGKTPEGVPYGNVTVNIRPNQLTFAELRPAGSYERVFPQ